MSDVWVKVKLPGELHEKFRRWVFDNDTTMQRRIVDLIESNKCGKPVVGPGEDRMPSQGGSTPPTAAKTIPMSAYVSGPPGVNIPTCPDESVSARHKCAICHESFPQSEMTYHAKTLKWSCKECVEKQA